jgi:NADH dehydrogenase FAD-containing subunit
MEEPLAKIVVSGAGIGGISAAYELRETLGRAADISVLSDSEWFQFTPSNRLADLVVHEVPSLGGCLGLRWATRT